MYGESHPSLNDRNSTDKILYRSKWEAECSLEPKILDWDICIDNLKKCTGSLNIRETMIKLLTRWYQTPTRVHKFFPTVSLLCFRGCQTLGSFLHVLSPCPPIWRKLTSIASIITGVQLSLNPSHCLLFSPIVEATTLLMRLIHTISVAIHWVVGVHWRNPLVPLLQVKLRVESINRVEKLFHTLYHTMPYDELKWAPWFDN